MLLSTFAFGPQNRQHLIFVLLIIIFASISHHTRAQLSSSKEDPQQNLGLFSPVGTSLPETANNTGVQSTQNTPSLAMPFIALQNAPIEQAPKNGVPASLSKLYKEKKWDEALLEIAEISSGIKALAKELNIPIVVLAQLNRNPESRSGESKGRPRLSDLRESGSIEQDADLVGLLVREEYYADSDESKQASEGKATLIIAKQRNGPVGDVELTFRKEFTRFETRAQTPKDD